MQNEGHRSCAGVFRFWPYTVKPSFYYAVTWREATAIRRQLDAMNVPYVVTSLPTGEIAFVFPDLPVRLYAQVRRIFSGDGRPIPRSYV
jgi:hypothetical protein